MLPFTSWYPRNIYSSIYYKETSKKNKVGTKNFIFEVKWLLHFCCVLWVAFIQEVNVRTNSLLTANVHGRSFYFGVPKEHL